MIERRPGFARVKTRVTVVGLVLGLTFVGWVAPAWAQGRRHAVVVQGASGGGEYAALHRGWLDALVGLLAGQYGFDAADLTVLAEQAGEGEERATAEAVRAALGRLAGELTDDDLLFVMLIGHGSGVGDEAKFNLLGPDLSVTDWRGLLQPIAGRMVVVDATSSSFPFLSGLAAPGRIVITATNSPAQRYHTVFAQAFIEALAAGSADSDQNGRVSVLEAFVYASRLVDLQYEQSGEMATEHAVLDDTGDGEGRLAEAEDAADGVVAEATYLAVVEVPTSSDPEVQRLLVRQQELNDELDDLRRRRSTMVTEEYDREFERLVTELAVVSAELRRRGGG